MAGILDVEIKHLPLEQFVNLISNNSNEPAAKRRRLSTPDDLDLHSALVLRHSTHRFRPVGRTNWENRDHVATLEKAAPCSLGEAELQIMQKPKRRGQVRGDPYVAVCVNGVELLELEDIDDLVLAGLPCFGVDVQASMTLVKGLARNGSPSHYIDFAIEIEVHVTLQKEFTNVKWPASAHPARLAFMQTVCPPEVDEEEIVTHHPNVALPAERGQPSVELIYAALPAPPREATDRKGKRADRPDQELNPPGLMPTLMPFQERSVRWMLAREGVKTDKSPSIGPDDAVDRLPIFWQPLRVESVDPMVANDWHFNRITGEVSISKPGQDKEQSPEGGMLCEEMGLGKTIEVLALIMLRGFPPFSAFLHSGGTPNSDQQNDRNQLPAIWDPNLEANVKPTSLTLIICPSAIVNQWEKEITKHAPALRIFRYESVKKLANSFTATKLSREYDVVLTTFDVLRQEVNFARAPVHRAMRSAKIGRPRHTWRRSLLIEIDFLRVVMDEPQMGANAGTIAETCSLIRRRYSWAVSGTPLRSKVADLKGILRFLRIDPVGYHEQSFQRLIGAGGLYPLVDLLQRISIRTVKASVADELHIPQQKRYMVPLEFGPVEKYAYQQRYEEAIIDLGLTLGKQSFGEDWELDATKMVRNSFSMRPSMPLINAQRTWLGRLRQLCCNQAVAAGGGSGAVRLRSLGDVLDSMREANTVALELDERAIAAVLIRKGHLSLYDHETCGNIEIGIKLFDTACSRLRPLRKRLEEEHTRLQKQLKVRKSQSPDDIEDEEEWQAERDLIKRVGAMANRIRDVLEALHSATFFRASAFYQLGKFPTEEARDYEEAEALRKLVLASGLSEVDKKLERLKERLTEGEQLDIADLEVSFTKSRPGIKSARAFEMVADVSDRLNGIAELLWQWRSELIKLLVEPLEGEEEEAPDGEEFVGDAEKQDEIDIRLELYQRLAYDWGALLTGERSAMADAVGVAAVAQKATQINDDVWVDMDTIAPAKRKKAKISMRDFIEALEEDTPLQRLRKSLELARYDLVSAEEHLKSEDRTSLRRGLRELVNVQREALRDEDIAIAEREAKRVKGELQDRQKAYDSLQRELQPIREAYNARVAYYSIIQDFSDSVEIIDVQAKDFAGVQQELQKATVNEGRLLLSIRAKEMRSRYLENLTDGNTLPSLIEACIICQETTSADAVLTQCGHCFCDGCFKVWHHRSRSCPLCKRPLGPKDWQKVSLSSVKPEPDVGGSVAMAKDDSLDSSLFNLVSEVLHDSISEIPIRGDIGTKLDFLARHVRYMRREDPEAKVVVFTAWKIALEVLRQAFDRNGIRYVQLEGSQKLRQQAALTFTEDPDVAVFLLHAESSAAGLNLISASTIILVEPLLHPSTELQAVGRVHRIGQSKETTVFQYCVADTPDQRIAHLAARKGTSLFTKQKRWTPEATPDVDLPINPDGVGETAVEDADDLAFALLAAPQRVQLQHHLLTHAGPVTNQDAMQE